MGSIPYFLVKFKKCLTLKHKITKLNIMNLNRNRLIHISNNLNSFQMNQVGIHAKGESLGKQIGVYNDKNNK